MKKIISVVAILMCAGVMGYAEEMETIDLQKALEEQTTAAEQEKINSVLNSVTLEQSQAISRVHSIMKRMLEELENKSVKSKRDFTTAVTLKHIINLHEMIMFMLSEHSSAINPDLKTIALGMCDDKLNNSLQNLQKQNHQLYEDILYLFSDPRLPEFERNFVQCVDGKKK